jgi:AcrR family transcriptional regulator
VAGRKRVQNEDGHQALKAKATRERILNAVVVLINESGYSSASSTAIAKKAGITWGAVQHHFGNKEEILLAVLEMARDVYIQSLGSAELKQGSLKKRIDRFIDIVWRHYKSDLYFAFSEIVMATRGQTGKLPLGIVRMNRQLEAHLETMFEIFGDYEVSDLRMKESLRFVHRFLTGFAMDRMLEPGLPYEDIHIQRLKDELFTLINEK